MATIDDPPPSLPVAAAGAPRSTTALHGDDCSYVVTNQHDEPLGLWLSETLIVTGSNAAEGAAIVWTASEGGEA